MRSKIYIFLLLILSSFAFSQNGTIKGKIKTSDSQAAEFVSVGLKNKMFGVSTNAKGEYEIKNVEPGTYTLMVSYIGLETKEQPVEVKSNETTLVNDILLKENATQLREVIITGVKNLNEKTVAISKINIKPMDLPQSISSIDRDILDQQQAQSMSDALKNFNGVYIMGTSGGYQQEIAGRGFAFGSSNTFKNGIRFNNTAMPELSSLEKVEVLKGSAAILFGNVAAGGIINLVTKKPTFTQGGEVSFRMDSYDFYKPAIDIYGVVGKGKHAAYRMNMVYEKARSFRDNVGSERFYANPSMIFRLGKKTELLIEGDYLKDNRTADFGVGTINYELIDVPRERFLGIAWSYYKTEQQSLTGSIIHRFNNSWQLKSTTGFQKFASDLFANQRPNGNSQFIRTNGNWVRGVQRTMVNEEYYMTQLDLTGRFKTFGIKHNLLLGVDADRYSTDNTAFNAITKYDSINVFDLKKYTQRYDVPDLTKRITTSNPVQRIGAYIQDLIEITKQIKLLAGVRFSYLESASSVLTHATSSITETKQFNDAITPRFGLVYQPSRTVSIFGSYANSFTPNTGLDINGAPLKPSYIDQFEAGVKTNLLKEALSANVTAYQIINSNLAQMSLENGNTNSNIKELAGEVTSKGVEVDIMTKSYHGIMLVAGYSYNETRYTKSNTYIVGSLLRYNPAHTGNASIYYTINKTALRGMNFGISYLYFGERAAGRSTRLTVANDKFKLITLPAYQLVDATIGYARQNISLRIKLSNIFDVLSYNVHDDNSVNPIPPRQFAATLSYKF
jgi:iron complex outermembrane receptor protein